MEREEYLVAHLSPGASQVLLALVLASQARTEGRMKVQAEFAIHVTSSLSGSHSEEALVELELLSLIRIVTYPGRPLQVELFLPVKEYDETLNNTLVFQTGTTPTNQPLLRQSNQGSSQKNREADQEPAGAALLGGNHEAPDTSTAPNSRSKTTEGRIRSSPVSPEYPTLEPGPGGESQEDETLHNAEVLGEVRAGKAGSHRPGSGSQTAMEQDNVVANSALPTRGSTGQDGLRGRRKAQPGLLEGCRLADKSGNKREKIVALRQVWDEVFPESEYPYQRLSNDAAVRFLSNGRTTEGVGRVILEVAERATNRIEYPRAYIEKALASADTKYTYDDGGRGGGETITDDLRRLTELGRKQFGGTNHAA